MSVETDTIKKPTERKIKKTELILPTKDDYVFMKPTNYTIKQLKEIALHYKIKLTNSTVKSDMFAKIYDYFKLYDKAVLIQRKWRRYLYKIYNLLNEKQ